MEGFIKPDDRNEVVACLGEVWSRWKNNYRYIDDDRLRSEYKRLELYKRIKGDMLKENSRVVVESAFQLCMKGASRWHSKKS